ARLPAYFDQTSLILANCIGSLNEGDRRSLICVDGMAARGQFEVSQTRLEARPLLVRAGCECSSKGMQVLISEPVLTATPSGDQLELRPGGAWVAANVARLEHLTEAVASELDRSGSLRVDMADVKELDTLGAWLLEKLSRGAVSRGHRAEIVGIADN